MLDGIIGKDKSPTPPPPPISKGPSSPPDEPKNSQSPSKIRKGSESSVSPERLKKEVLDTMKRGKSKTEEKLVGQALQISNIRISFPYFRLSVKAELDEDGKPKPQFNFVYYDPELHWCSTCDIFPKTAKEYLNHLHSEQHRAKLSSSASAQEYPWREKLSAEDNSTRPGLPSKRIPIRGLQFFVPATAWFCKICKHWMGDLHCASVHLKSKLHAANYGVSL